MGRQIRSNVLQVTETLTPQWPFLDKFRRCKGEFKQKQKANYDARHGTRPLPEIPDDTAVWVTTNGRQSQGRVIAPANAPRSYLVETPSGQVRRNHTHLNVIPETQPPEHESTTGATPTPTRSPIMTRSRTGTNIAPPNRL